ncbi:MAG: DUF1405 domain-containing protein [Ardenticatenaceae bacterium]|nr:DUF1405 domain-containing protein [Ardenticatenaceae bacterium]HBY99135.1 hypothetical protein [Chloroflexota bacterium]
MIANLIRRLYAVPLIEWGLVVINLFGFVIGTVYWYGPQMAIISPLLWPWLVDSPLSVLGFALALPLIRRARTPAHEWLATWAVFSNIKYGLWTVAFWLLWWRGPGTFTLESVTMTFTHAAMVVMGASLLVFYRPKLWQVITVAAWFAFNDYLDYWGGIAPTVPPGVSLETLKVEQLVVSAVLTLGLLGLALRRPAAPLASPAQRFADR